MTFSYKHYSALAAVSSHFQNGLHIFISGTLPWAVGVPPKPLIQLPHWLNCSVNKKSKIFLYPTNALQSCSGKFVMHEAAAVPY